MTPNKNDCIPEQFIFEQVKSPPVVVNFKGEPVTSDAGLYLIAELDRKLAITSRFAGCFKDYRDKNRTDYSVTAFLKLKIFHLWQYLCQKKSLQKF
ncbi:transposase [Calothrix sp. CCY 0018]|uniref:transposase n=1 Tax=Calothrix sp. CCY 0018 TaxID=3103864 RepID=UPI0039C69036